MKTTIEISDKKYSIIPQNNKALMSKLAAVAHSLITDRVAKGVHPPNAELTKAIKKGDKTLRDNGTLLTSIRFRSNEAEAIVASSHIAAIVNNPKEDITSFTITPKKAKSLAIPAGSKTRTLQRRYGFSAKDVLNGLEEDGYTVFRPRRKGSNTRANVIMAVLKEGKTLKSGKKSTAAKYQPFPVFILCKSVKVPVRRFLFLTDDELKKIDGMVEEFFTKK